MVFDVTNRDSFENVEHWLTDIQEVRVNLRHRAPRRSVYPPQELFSCARPPPPPRLPYCERSLHVMRATTPFPCAVLENTLVVPTCLSLARLQKLDTSKTAIVLVGNKCDLAGARV